MEVLSPAGNPEKLRMAYLYGADAAYMGLPEFSLRARADSVEDVGGPELLTAIKSEHVESPEGFGASGKSPQTKKKLYCALNIFFHNRDLVRLEQRLERIAEYPFDAFILSDIGVLSTVQRYLPGRELHLSTQANCTNWQAAQSYFDMGFSRIVPARELTLEEIAEMKVRVPKLELEVFVHGAMCMSYSGRCILSAEKTGRSANRGDCAQNCRWNYRIYLEEESRPGTFIPVDAGQPDQSNGGGAYTALLSSKDLCLIDHLDELRDAGVDSIKIEGRMKSLYYVALTTRAYRWAVDNPGQDQLRTENPYRQDLFEFSHREYGTGFLFDPQSPNISSKGAHYEQSHLFLGVLTAVEGAPNTFSVSVKNSIRADAPMELIGPTFGRILEKGEFRLLDSRGIETEVLHATDQGGAVQLFHFGPEHPSRGLMLRRRL